jgi:release factor glutamine methyltransferase
MAAVKGLATAALIKAGVINPAAEVRVLLAWLTGLEPNQLWRLDSLTATQTAELDAAIERRCGGEPLQHITGLAYFRHLTVQVGPGVFVPRPETEVLVDWALDRLRDVGPGGQIVELCAGSGAIAASLALEADPGRIWAVERSDEAWSWLQRNLRGTIVEPVHADMAGALPDLNGDIDLVVANPPYIDPADVSLLSAEVLADPAEALFSPEHGLAASRTVVQVAWRLLKAGGWLGTEHGDQQGPAVVEIMVRQGFQDVRTYQDLTGRDRFTVGRR